MVLFTVQVNIADQCVLLAETAFVVANIVCQDRGDKYQLSDMA